MKYLLPERSKSVDFNGGTKYVCTDPSSGCGFVGGVVVGKSTYTTTYTASQIQNTQLSNNYRVHLDEIYTARKA